MSVESRLEWIRRRKGTITVSYCLPAGDTPWSERAACTIKSDTGIEVNLTYRIPANPSGRVPAVILLGGFLAGRRAIEYVPESVPFAVVALSYPYRGEVSANPWRLMSSLPGLDRAAWHTPASILLALDFLQAHPEVDGRRVGLVAASLGVPVGCMAAAADHRVRALALINGGAGLPDLVVRAAGAFGWAHEIAIPVRLALKPILSRFEPGEYLARVSPRPVLLVNGEQDPVVPVESAKALFESAREPKEQRWFDVGHLSPDPARLHDLSVELFQWLAEKI